MAWSDAIYAVADAFKGVFSWATGDRTKDQNTLRDEAEHWKGEYDRAMAGGDYVHANHAMRELRRVRDEARAKS